MWASSSSLSLNPQSERGLSVNPFLDSTVLIYFGTTSSLLANRQKRHERHQRGSHFDSLKIQRIVCTTMIDRHKKTRHVIIRRYNKQEAQLYQTLGPILSTVWMRFFMTLKSIQRRSTSKTKNDESGEGMEYVDYLLTSRQATLQPQSTTITVYLISLRTQVNPNPNPPPHFVDTELSIDTQF